MGNELRPCPYCAGNAHAGVELQTGRFYVECDACLARTWVPSACGRDSAKAAWNRRDNTDDAETAAQLAALRAEVERLTRERDALIAAWPWATDYPEMARNVIGYDPNRGWDSIEPGVWFQTKAEAVMDIVARLDSAAGPITPPNPD